MTDQPRKPWTPDWAVHPGEILDEWMGERRVRVAELAATTALAPEVIMEVRRCRGDVTAEVAERLAMGTHIATATWLSLQEMYDDHQRRAAVGDTAPDEGL